MTFLVRQLERDAVAKLKGFYTLKCPKSFFLISRYFYNLNLKHVHIHSKKAKIIKKIYLQWGCATSPNVPKLGVSGVKDTAKTNKDLGMSCYIQVEYSIFSAGSPL